MKKKTPRKHDSLYNIGYDMYDKDGNQIVKQLDRLIIVNRNWATILFVYKSIEKGEWSKEKISLRRYQKIYGGWQHRGKFNITSPKMAYSVGSILKEYGESNADQQVDTAHVEHRGNSPANDTQK